MQHVCQDRYRAKLAKSTRFPGNLPVFDHFYPSTRFFNISTRFWNSQNLLFLPVNIGEIRETTIYCMKVNNLFLLACSPVFVGL